MRSHLESSPSKHSSNFLNSCTDWLCISQLYKVYREPTCFGELSYMQVFDKFFWRKQRMATKTEECSPKKQTGWIQILPKGVLNWCMEKIKICILRPSELWLKTYISSNLFHFLSQGKEFRDALNATSTAVTDGYYKEIPDLWLLYESIVQALRTKAQNLVFTHLWCSSSRTGITFT